MDEPCPDFDSQWPRKKSICLHVYADCYRENIKGLILYDQSKFYNDLPEVKCSTTEQQ